MASVLLCSLSHYVQLPPIVYLPRLLQCSIQGVRLMNEPWCGENNSKLVTFYTLFFQILNEINDNPETLVSFRWRSKLLSKIRQYILGINGRVVTKYLKLCTVLVSFSGRVLADIPRKLPVDNPQKRTFQIYATSATFPHTGLLWSQMCQFAPSWSYLSVIKSKNPRYKYNVSKDILISKIFRPVILTQKLSFNSLWHLYTPDSSNKSINASNSSSCDQTRLFLLCYYF